MSAALRPTPRRPEQRESPAQGKRAAYQGFVARAPPRRSRSAATVISATAIAAGRGVLVAVVLLVGGVDDVQLATADPDAVPGAVGVQPGATQKKPGK